MIFWWGMETTSLKYILRDPALKLSAPTQQEQWSELTTYLREFSHTSYHTHKNMYTCTFHCACMHVYACALSEED